MIRTLLCGYIIMLVLRLVSRLVVIGNERDLGSLARVETCFAPSILMSLSLHWLCRVFFCRCRARQSVVAATDSRRKSRGSDIDRL
jgi:hypothetical protein